MSSQESYLDALKRVIDEVVAPGAAAVDADGAFPRAQLDALGAAGLLALTVPAEFGGGGAGLREAAVVVRELGAVCGSTAMVVTMHYCGGRRAGRGRRQGHPGGDRGRDAPVHAGVLRGRVAVPLLGADGHRGAGAGRATVRLDASKSWVTSAGHADSYVWSSRPLIGGADGADGSADAAGPMTLWLVPAGAAGLSAAGAFDGLGLRGNASAPMTADGVVVPLSAMLGADGGGLDLALAAVLPFFLICSAAMSAGLIRRLATETAAHLQRTQLQHLGQSLAQQAQPRAQLARLRIEADRTWALIETRSPPSRPAGRTPSCWCSRSRRPPARRRRRRPTWRCGPAAARRSARSRVVERLFRDSRAARVMAPTTEALHDFIGRALCGLPLLGDV